MDFAWATSKVFHGGFLKVQVDVFRLLALWGQSPVLGVLFAF